MTTETPPVSPILLGTTSQQPPEVLEVALSLARRAGTVLVCAQVDPMASVVEEHPDGSVESRPIDPDRADWDSATFDPDLAVRIQAAAREAGVEVTFRSLAGDVGAALGRLAEVVGAEMIVVGSREGGVRASMHDFFSGSLAAHLSHHQSRPVVVVPIGPTATGGAAPRKDRGR
ncbi:Universal stress protein family protein [Microlunatus sagamiharensis]|uniref:Universal stress protein family protein n=1 Tax=Microlunatus sagamiharensis TaxID=546874 RepID=A0A1H2M4G3_9ACTN|nr:universal stress protein [Microlunatus sagamiharensis]SDU88002.1 Universal stress protein family protein [Microlunatus sagamiharensis]